MEEYFTNGKSKISLTLIIHRLKDEDFKGDKSVFIKFIFSLLRSQRVKTDYLFAKDINDLMDELEEKDKKDLLEIQYVIDNLSLFDINNLRSKL
jgi:hypothetical protein